MKTPITLRFLAGALLDDAGALLDDAAGARWFDFMSLRPCYHLAAREQTGAMAVLSFGRGAGPL